MIISPPVKWQDKVSRNSSNAELSKYVQTSAHVYFVVNGINKLYQTRHSYLQSGYRWNLSLGSTQLAGILTFARYILIAEKNIYGFAHVVPPVTLVTVAVTFEYDRDINDNGRVYDLQLSNCNI